MSDTVQCDKCGRSGRRRRFTIAPAGWRYCSVVMDGVEHYLYACSLDCENLTWVNGPGDLLADASAPPKGGE